MDQLPPETVVLRLQLLAEPIQGWLALAGSEERHFCGWLELATALEALRSATDTGSLTSREERDGGWEADA